MKKFTTSILLFAVAACNAKGVECADSTQPCVSTQVNEETNESSFEHEETSSTTTINNDTTIVNNPVVNAPPAVGAGGSSNNDNVNDAGTDAGSGGAGGSGGNSSSDAGDASNHVVVLCDSPNAVPTDVRNWFATNPNATDWFQLVTFDGFSEDRCTYTGKIKWFYEGPGGFWESDREWDSPQSTFTIGFTSDGFVKGTHREPTEIYPNGYLVSQEFSVDRCCLQETYEDVQLSFDPTYRYYNWLVYGSGNHPSKLYIFRGTWFDNRPIMVQQYYPPYAG